MHKRHRCRNLFQNLNNLYMNKGTKWMVGIAVLLGIIAGAGAYLVLEEQKLGRKPPKNAPQLELDNPGTQADFPSAATESEVG